jgi:hypothetical protein
MESSINWKKIGQYIMLAFGISWTAALIMDICGMSYGSVPAVAMIAMLYMPGPAIATYILQKFIYKESFEKYGWSFDKAYLSKYVKVGL